MSPITCHVLDTATGEPARGLRLRLDVLDAHGNWQPLAERATNDDGRVTDLMSPDTLGGHTYRITFSTGPYFAQSGRPVFYPWVEVVFVVASPAQHYHIPLLLSPFGYSTYRGT